MLLFKHFWSKIFKCIQKPKGLEQVPRGFSRKPALLICKSQSLSISENPALSRGLNETRAIRTDVDRALVMPGCSTMKQASKIVSLWSCTDDFGLPG